MGILDSVIGFRQPGVARLRDGTALAPGHVDTLPLCEEARWGEERWQHGGNGVADRWVRCEKDAVMPMPGRTRARRRSMPPTVGVVRTITTADYLQLTGGTLSGDLEIDSPAGFAQIILDGATGGGVVTFEKNNVYQGELASNSLNAITLTNASGYGMTLATSGIATSLMMSPSRPRSTARAGTAPTRCRPKTRSTIRSRPWWLAAAPTPTNRPRMPLARSSPTQPAST